MVVQQVGMNILVDDSPYIYHIYRFVIYFWRLLTFQFISRSKFDNSFIFNIYTTLGYIVSLIFLNLGHVFHTHTANDAKAKHVSQVQEN